MNQQFPTIDGMKVTAVQFFDREQWTTGSLGGAEAGDIVSLTRGHVEPVVITELIVTIPDDGIGRHISGSATRIADGEHITIARPNGSVHFRCDLRYTKETS